MNFINYVKETKVEMKHVTWPTRRQAVLYTIFVIVTAIFVGVFLGLFDYLFTFVVEKII